MQQAKIYSIHSILDGFVGPRRAADSANGTIRTLRLRRELSRTLVEGYNHHYLLNGYNLQII